jgi:hypothetical protein
MQVLQFASYLLYLNSESPTHFVPTQLQSLLLPQTVRPSFMPKYNNISVSKKLFLVQSVGFRDSEGACQALQSPALFTSVP